jgi:hypothetical protein
MKHKIFNNKTKTYTFNYMIYTDGYGTSVQFIEEKQLEKENIKKISMKQVKEKNKIEYAGLEKEEIKIIKAQKLIETKNKELKFKEDKQKIKKELIKKLKEDAQKLKEDNKKLKEDNKKLKEDNKKFKKKITIDNKKNINIVDNVIVDNIIVDNVIVDNVIVDNVIVDNVIVDNVIVDNVIVDNVIVNNIIIKKEFKYLEEMTDEEINESKNNYIVIDPGKRTILQMMQYKNNKTNILTYTSKQRTFEIKTNEFKKKLKNYKIKNKMIELETELSKTCCRTVDIEEFKNYIKKRNGIYDNMELLYEQSKCRRTPFQSSLK